ncbi:aminotransferase class V-fold PLP-dependent enzyme [Phaeobacter sp. JH20_36]|uniref:pyridoxal-phosphate-dependent aminotransferase family protein n=1 Tax=unclassified Phaeobacter TaxID=2621772 RepID=UPI003A844AEB
MIDAFPILAAGPETILIPGPSILPDAVRTAIQRPSIDIYSGPLLDVTARCEAGLQKAFGTSQRVFLYAANGHGVWDAALCNTLSRGDRILVLESGRFALGWGDMAEAMGLQIEILPGDWHRPIDTDALIRRLKEDSANEIAAILCVQVDTASGVCNKIGAIRQAIDVTGHSALLMVDAIASLGTMPFAFDEWHVDVAVSASQKGLMCPAGLGFVVAGPRALAAHASAGLRSRYWDWTARMTGDHYSKYCGTPPEQLLFGLAAALDMMEREGLGAVFARHAALRDATLAAIGQWAAAGAMANIMDPSARAPSVSVLNFADTHAHRIIAFCKQHCGVTLGRGLGDWANKSIRIGHMGHINAPTILGAISSIDLALKVLGIQADAGGAGAAIEALANLEESRA